MTLEPTNPDDPSSLKIENRSETSVEISGFGIETHAIEIDFLSSCVTGDLKRNVTSQGSNADDVIAEDLIPGCLFSIRYASVCFADTGIHRSGFQQSTMEDKLCTCKFLNFLKRQLSRCDAKGHKQKRSCRL